MKKSLKSFIKVCLLVTLFLVSKDVVFAADVNLTVRNGDNVVFSSPVTIPTGVTTINDDTDTAHAIDANSVLSVIVTADQTSDNFNISDLQYFSSFGSLYIKCITDINGEACDNWQYAVDGSYPFSSVDQNILSGSENIFLFFGPQNRVTLSSNSITTNDILTATAQSYNYENNAWVTRTGVTIGLTQPNPSDPFNPTEVMTAPVDANGQAVFALVPAGSYNVGVKEDFYFPTEALTVTTAPPPTSSSGGGGSKSNNQSEGSVLGVETKKNFDLKKAFDFLIAQQKEDGSFGEDIYTDWTALALSTGNHQGEVIKLIKYLGERKLENPTLTDYERHAMALMALGLNPYNIYPSSDVANGKNYIEKITGSFDGKQFGDINEDNDDIFALIVLQNAGYTQDEKIIKDDISFIISAQKEDGSWDGSVDMTGAAMEALAYFNQDEQARPNDQEVGRVKNALEKAKEFLKKNQKDDGGWSNASSTAWALEGIMALGEKAEDWKKGKEETGNTPIDYLATIQDTDGGIKNLSAGEEGDNMQNKIWQTAYVVSALSGKSWNQIMQKYEKPKDAGSVLGVSTEVKTKVTPKKAALKPKIETQKNITIENESENTTTVNNVLPENLPEPEPKKENWFIRFLKFIF